MTINNFKSILCEENDKILTITINRPDTLNALSKEVLEELKEALLGICRDINFKIQGIILTGSGEKAFIAGADIKAMDTMTTNDAESFARLGQEVSRLLETVPVPVIACVNGFALGGGCEIAMSCDIIYASKSAIFGQPEVNLGLIPGFGGTQRLMRFVGTAMAKEIIYTGRNIKIDEAKEIGLVQRVFEDRKSLIEGANQTLKIIKGKSPLIVSKCKEVIQNGESKSIEEGLNIEAEGFRFVFGTEDKAEGVTAFLEKRKPIFTGK